jgi:hypothetical protein
MCRLAEFKGQIEKSIVIFDIMAVAYKFMLPYEANFKNGNDESLKIAISVYQESSELNVLRSVLMDWADNHISKRTDENKVRELLCYLIRLIDEKCASDAMCSLPDTFEHRLSLNRLLYDEITVITKHKDGLAMKKLHESIEIKEKTLGSKDPHGFYKGKHAQSAYLQLNNFIIFGGTIGVAIPNGLCPMLHTPCYASEILENFKNNGYSLKVGITPLSNESLFGLFICDKQNGLFSVIGPQSREKEDILVERCIQTLNYYAQNNVDIAIFPEMLFTEYVQEKIRNYAKNYFQQSHELPWFIWLGSSWSDRKNRCMVIDRYGNKVFEQMKHVPYEFSEEEEEKELQSTSGQKLKKTTYTEDLKEYDKWVVNFLDIPGLFRISTAICRDIADINLALLLETMLSDFLIVPAFSPSNRLSEIHLTPLVSEKMLVAVCNSCSAFCKKNQTHYEINQDRVGEKIKFCHFSVPTKAKDNNECTYHNVRFNEDCVSCSSRCKGRIFSIFFSECDEESFSPRVTQT